MSSRILVTGADGFVGSYVSLWPGAIPLVEQGARVDLKDLSALTRAIKKMQPNRVIHLAAQSLVPLSFHMSSETYAINFTGTLNLLTALRENKFEGRFLFVGSGDVYGQVPIEEMPIREDRPLRPRSPYAVSKVAAEALCYQWSQTEPFEVIMARPFNHIGLRQSPQFVVANFAQQISEIKLGKRRPVLEVGDINVTRDFTDVRDVVKAYKLLLDYGRCGEIYNVCSGQERSIRSILESLIEMAGVNVRIQQDQERLRPSEQQRMWGSYEKLNRDTGWAPAISFQQTLHETLAYWEGIK